MTLPHARTIRYVFLDRDGVLNRKRPEGEYVTRWSEFEWLPGAVEALARMRRAHLILILVTNQRGVALGLMDETELQAIHEKMQSYLEEHGARLDGIYYCPHDKGQCDCRKPATGLFREALEDFPGAGPRESLVIGDSLPDIEAGKRLGMATIFIAGDPERQKPGSTIAAREADAVASSLLDAAEKDLDLHR
ncbi:MAG TPA: HAD family hydrolase [Acidobacteriaceae bacterium]|jgi:D-glycero-D-manno-heptose 1,7-bisphosphate phosphatase|nr:HAD family hydrolase [Acidobacteriaceae bacterium]